MTRGGPVKPAARLTLLLRAPREGILVLLDAQPVLGNIGALLLAYVLRDRGLVEAYSGDVVALRPELPVPELVLEVRVSVEHE